MSRTNRLHWINETPGQMIEHLRPQLAGASDGEAGPGTGIRVHFGRSDRTWSMYIDRVEVLTGTGEPLEAEEAVSLRSQANAALDQRRELHEVREMWLCPSGRVGEIVQALLSARRFTIHEARRLGVGTTVCIAQQVQGDPEPVAQYVVRKQKSGHTILAELDWETGAEGDEIAVSETEPLIIC